MKTVITDIMPEVFEDPGKEMEKPLLEEMKNTRFNAYEDINRSNGHEEEGQLQMSRRSAGRHS